jgi:serine/threonine protein kinase
MTLANRYIYSLFRKSKAQRAYENSNWLNSKGITSPESVAFIDCYKYGMLRESFFVSVYTSYKPIKELFESPISESEEGLKAFARFTYSLHQKGVFHRDYSANNILYKLDGLNYDFALIDINRMKISGYSFRKGIKTLNRLDIPVEGMGIVAAEYSRVSGISDLEMLNAMVFIRLLHQVRNLLKKWVKAPIHYLTR